VSKPYFWQRVKNFLDQRRSDPERPYTVEIETDYFRILGVPLGREVEIKRFATLEEAEKYIETLEK